MEAEIWAQVGGREYTIIDYTQAGKPPINFYTAFYEYQKKGGDFITRPACACRVVAGTFTATACARCRPILLVPMAVGFKSTN